MPTQWTPAGARRRKVTIQQQSTASTTGLGFLTGTWADVLTTWAKVTPRALTTFAGTTPSDQPMTRNSYALNLRFPPSISILPGMRVVEADGGAIYLVQSTIDPEERHRELVLMCSQIPAPASQEQ